MRERCLGCWITLIVLKGRLVELERPAAYHTSPIFPPHTFRNGDLARIEPNVVAGTKKPKKPVTGAEAKSQQQAEGVVYRVRCAQHDGELRRSNEEGRSPIPRSSSRWTPPTMTLTSLKDAASSNLRIVSPMIGGIAPSAS